LDQYSNNKFDFFDIKNIKNEDFAPEFAKFSQEHDKMRTAFRNIYKTSSISGHKTSKSQLKIKFDGIQSQQGYLQEHQPINLETLFSLSQKNNRNFGVK